MRSKRAGAGELQTSHDTQSSQGPATTPNRSQLIPIVQARRTHSHINTRLRCPSCRRPHRRPLVSRFGDHRITCSFCGSMATLAAWRAAA
jgi:hypothetical protein